MGGGIAKSYNPIQSVKQTHITKMWCFIERGIWGDRELKLELGHLKKRRI